MTNINLLPWREEKRWKETQQFIVVAIASIAITATFTYAGLLLVESMLDEQIKRNQFLQNHTETLEQTRSEISTLEIQKNDLVSRISIIQNLQLSRSKVIKILDTIPKIIPDGVYLEKIERTGNQLTLTGVADSNPLISIFMRKLKDSPEFEQANLEIVERKEDDRKAQKFILLVYESLPDISPNQPDTETDLEI